MIFLATEGGAAGNFFLPVVAAVRHGQRKGRAGLTKCANLPALLSQQSAQPEKIAPHIGRRALAVLEEAGDRGSTISLPQLSSGNSFIFVEDYQK